jgi:hypothetical protein
MIPGFDSETKRDVAYIFSNGYPRRRPVRIAVPFLTRMHPILKNLRRTERRTMRIVKSTSAEPKSEWMGTVVRITVC